MSSLWYKGEDESASSRSVALVNTRVPLNARPHTNGSNVICVRDGVYRVERERKDEAVKQRPRMLSPIRRGCNRWKGCIKFETYKSHLPPRDSIIVLGFLEIRGTSLYLFGTFVSSRCLEVFPNVRYDLNSKKKCA